MFTVAEDVLVSERGAGPNWVYLGGLLLFSSPHHTSSMRAATSRVASLSTSASLSGSRRVSALSRHFSGATFFSDAKLRSKFIELPPKEPKSLVEYVWIGGSGQDLRSKTRTLSKVPSRPEDVPVWNYDGSSTGQAEGKNSEITIIARYTTTSFLWVAFTAASAQHVNSI
jgi:hypothetical protein